MLIVQRNPTHFEEPISMRLKFPVSFWYPQGGVVINISEAYSDRYRNSVLRNIYHWVSLLVSGGNPRESVPLLKVARSMWGLFSRTYPAWMLQGDLIWLIWIAFGKCNSPTRVCLRYFPRLGVVTCKSPACSLCCKGGYFPFLRLSWQWRKEWCLLVVSRRWFLVACVGEKWLSAR